MQIGPILKPNKKCTDGHNAFRKLGLMSIWPMSWQRTRTSRKTWSCSRTNPRNPCPSSQVHFWRREEEEGACEHTLTVKQFTWIIEWQFEMVKWQSCGAKKPSSCRPSSVTTQPCQDKRLQISTCSDTRGKTQEIEMVQVQTLEGEFAAGVHFWQAPNGSCTRTSQMNTGTLTWSRPWWTLRILSRKMRTSKTSESLERWHNKKVQTWLVGISARANCRIFATLHADTMRDIKASSICAQDVMHGGHRWLQRTKATMMAMQEDMKSLIEAKVLRGKIRCHDMTNLVAPQSGI